MPRTLGWRPPPRTAPEWQDAYLDEQTAKAAYQEAVDAAHREHLPEPPPFAEVAAAEETETEMTPPTVDGQLYGG